MQKFKIKSLTDVITNSSTEVFTIYNDDAIKRIKNLVNSILALSDNISNLTFDDIFDIDYHLDFCYDDEKIDDIAEKLAEEGYKEDAAAIKTTVKTEEDLQNYAKQHNIYDVVIKIMQDIDDYTYDYRMIDGISIKPKDNPNVDKEKLNKAVILLNNIDNIFEQYATYN